MATIRALLRPRTLLIIALGLFVLIQLVPVWAVQTNPPTHAERAWASQEARAVARRACFDCHSNQTIWPLYSKIAPASWLITYDVLKGREKLNLSEWGAVADEPGEAGEEIAEVLREGEMPPRAYILLHPEAKLTAAEQLLLIDEFQRAGGLRPVLATR
jgi:mono/diheme cytochrome c family protein